MNSEKIKIHWLIDFITHQNDLSIDKYQQNLHVKKTDVD